MKWGVKQLKAILKGQLNVAIKNLNLKLYNLFMC